MVYYTRIPVTDSIEEYKEECDLDHSHGTSDQESAWVEQISTENTIWKEVIVPHFIPSWEGLRGIAVLMTCVSHIDRGPNLFHHYSGVGGVGIFFVLSGFLITGVLLKLQTTLSNPSSNYKHLKKFYTDRSVRLYPALIVMVFSTSIFYIYFRLNGQTPPNFWYHVTYVLFYVSNLEQPSLRATPKTLWTNTWSLSTEEQFYIMWSLALPLIVKLRPRQRIIVATSLFSLSFLVFLTAGLTSTRSWILTFDNPFRNFWKMLFGALFRLCPVPDWIQEPRIAWMGLGLLGVSYVASMSPVPIDLTSIGFGRLFGHLIYHEVIVSISTILILLGTVKYGNRFLEGSVLRFIGRVSYSFYLYQSPLLMFTERRRGYDGVAVTALAFVVASLSTIFIEEPIRDWYRNRAKKLVTSKAEDVESQPVA